MVRDPNTDDILTWDRSKSTRNGQWDMGHKTGKSYDSLKQKYLNCKISRKKMLEEYNEPENYYPEKPGPNRSNKNT